MSYVSRTTVFYEGNPITCESFDIRIRRGRSRELNRYRGASGHIWVRNHERTFDPEWDVTSGALLQEQDNPSEIQQEDLSSILLDQTVDLGGSGTVTLGGELTVFDGATQVFGGHAEDIDYIYGRAGLAEAKFDVGDAFSSLAGADFGSQLTTPWYQRPGERIEWLLDQPDIAFPTGATYRDIATGHELLPSDVIPAGRMALPTLQVVEATDFGRLYTNRTGRLTFRGRFDIPDVTSPVASWQDDNPADAYSPTRIQTKYGSELLIFRATITRALPEFDPVDPGVTTPRGDDVPVTDPDSKGTPRIGVSLTTPPPRIGRRGFQRSGLLLHSDASAQVRADYIVERFDSPAATISQLVVSLDRIETIAGLAAREAVAAIDISDPMTVTFSPAGLAPPVTQTLMVDEVTYETSRRRGRQGARMIFQLSPIDSTDYFTWDSSVLDGPDVWGF